MALHSLGIPHPTWLRSVLVVALVLLGGVMTALAYLRWARVEKAMRTLTPLPAFTLGLAMALAVVVIAVLLAVALGVSPS